ncbi:MAG TPA: bifunctional phosphoribosylaminoimidazolecarboxamide formyltransferase/IMP cyclohydrolase, partial [Gemmatimonadales bacterium]|nr:bifunctional phosphoribosylaminoimidazolecarboxamide formyltransferase/IMP cyclohydrolase [Gemmatimonadales bacterium]
MRALISVSDKRGVAAFARELVQLGWEIVSTGGTAEALRKDGVPVISIDEVTGFPEMMDGRVKTLHPKVHGGLLARRDNPEHVAAMKQHGITAIDLVAVNLYPFRETVAKPDTSFEHAIENIDIGGPSMLRSAAKNHESVVVIVDPADYPGVVAALKAGGVPADERRRLATKVYAHTSAYDAAITNYLSTRGQEPFPPSVALVLERRQALRYGENPHQPAALYVTDEGRGMRDLVQLHGKELSFNNLLDVDAAVSAVLPWDHEHPACAIIKHTTPCGLALGGTAAEAYQRAFATDRQSAFGSVIAYNVPVDRAAAEAMRDLFVEVVVAPAVAEDALAVFREKKNLRVITLP